MSAHKPFCRRVQFEGDPRWWHSAICESRRDNFSYAALQAGLARTTPQLTTVRLAYARAVELFLFGPRTGER